jgi:hypothetical protein
VCLFTDQFDRDVGAGFLSRLDDQQVWFECGLSADYIPEWTGRLAAKVTPSPNQAFQRRLALLCPACGERRDSLWYTGEWACWRCLRLHLRRQLVDEETLKWERKAELEGLIGKGRPHWWRQSRYQTLRNELDQLEDELRWREERVASVQHARLIRAEWYRVAEVQDRFTAFPNFYVDDGQPIIDYNRTKARPELGFHRPARRQAMDFSSLDDLSEPHSR